MNTVLDEFRDTFSVDPDTQRFRDYSLNEMAVFRRLVGALGMTSVVRCYELPMYRSLPVRDLVSRYIEPGILSSERFAITPLISFYGERGWLQDSGAGVYSIPESAQVRYSINELPPALSSEDLDFFARMRQQLGLRAVAGAVPGNVPDPTVDELLGMLGNTGNRARNGDFLVGPYIMSTELGYQHRGVMLYERVTEELGREVADESPKLLSIFSR